LISNREGMIPSLNHLSATSQNLLVAFHSAALLMIDDGHRPAGTHQFTPFIVVKSRQAHRDTEKGPIPTALWTAIMTIVVTAAVIGCAGSKTADKMKPQDRIVPCPDTPNCVSSEAQDPRHAVAPMQLAGNPEKAWVQIRAKVDALPRSRIVAATEHYLHATLKSRLFGFIDDLELKLDPQTNMIGIRSASRTGAYDLGVNRRRVENLRQQLKAAALIR
jgi:uncharacterized protein (DUF1499 family)